MIQKITKQVEVEVEKVEVIKSTKIEEKDFYIASNGKEFTDFYKAEQYEEKYINMKHAEWYIHDEVNTFQSKDHLEEYLDKEYRGNAIDEWGFDASEYQYPVRKVIKIEDIEIPDTKDEWGQPEFKRVLKLYDVDEYLENTVSELKKFLENGFLD